MSTVASPPTPITPTGEVKPLLSLTDAAIEKVKYFATSMPDSQGKPLRIFVQGGGCSGFQYGFQFDEKKDDDNVIEQGGITVLVDPQSATYLKDCTRQLRRGLPRRRLLRREPQRHRRLRLRQVVPGVRPGFRQKPEKPRARGAFCYASHSNFLPLGEGEATLDFGPWTLDHRQLPLTPTLSRR